jgi:3-hydroxyacyl-[acyl-carrier-protein] dehydratase
MMDVTEIRELIPHRYPFLMVDRIVELEKGERIVGIKNVTVNESFFQGHFPTKPIMPGVMVCEAMAQVGAIFAKCSADETNRDKIFLLTGLDRVKFKNAVVPGDQLRIELLTHKRRGGFWKMAGVVSVDGKVVAEGQLSAMEVPFE